MIYESTHCNMPCYVLENESVQVKVLKDFGAKTASFVYKNTGHEFLFQPAKKRYDVPEFADSFEKYDTSGIDDMLPTIDVGVYPNTRIKTNDHGDLWSKRWDMKVEKDKLICSCSSEFPDLLLVRTMSLEDSVLVLRYELKNNDSVDRYYIWAFHGLMNFDDETLLHFGEKSDIIDVTKIEKSDFDYNDLGAYEDGSSCKWYFKDEISKGLCGFYSKKTGLKLSYIYDTDINKYLGVWVTKGGFKGEYNFAIEPCSGYYDSLERAFVNKKVSVIKKNETLNWYLKLKIEEV